MKETIQTTAYIAIVVIFIISLFIFPRYLMDEGTVVEYRIDNSTNETIGVYPVIVRVIENGSDDYIYLPKYTFEEAIQLTDSLNKQLKP